MTLKVFITGSQGNWEYKTTSNVRKLDGKTGSFSVTKPSRQNHGPVRVAHTYHFDYADGTPYEDLVFRFWNATVAGTYCGHGETYKSDDQILWRSKGGVLKGQSPARLAFLKKVLNDAPAEGIEPIEISHPEYGGQPGKYYLV